MRAASTRATIAVVALAAIARVAAQQPPRPQFETRADLILIDANIVDGNGAPVGDIAASEVVVSIDGKPRPIASIQFVKTAAQSEAKPPAPTPTDYSTNEGVSTGRRMLIVVDENSLPPGGGRAVLMSTERFLQGLAPADVVAFIRLPRFEDAVDFTSDRTRVFEAIKKVVGRATRVGFGGVGIAEAVAFERRSDFEWQRAISRICAGLTGPELLICQQNAESEARDLTSTYQQRARETMNGLAQLIANMHQVPGPKTLILLSQGFLAYDYHSEVARLADAATAARVSLYVMQIDLQGFDIAEAQPSPTRFEDSRLMAEGIENLAGASRGARFTVAGSGEGVFTRIARELSGYYLIGLEPTDADRDGKPHRIKVDVKRSGLTVRSRAQFTIGALAASAAPASPAEQLLQLLRAPTVDSGVPLRIATFTMTGKEANRVSVVAGVDVGPPATTAQKFNVGLVVVDKDGKIVGNQVGAVTLQPPETDPPTPPRYLANVDVPAGEYIVRFAVIDAEGHTGSVHRPISATLKEAGPVSVSDLIVTAPVKGSTGLRPEARLTIDGQAMHAMVELAAADARQVNDARVVFEVAETAGGNALVSERGRLAKGDGRGRPSIAVLDVGVLPPGSYVARAVVTVSGRPPVTSTRPFEIAPRKRRDTRTAAASGEARSTPVASRMRPPIPPFKTQDVLAPAVVNPFVDYVMEHYSPSPAARQALESIKAGDIANAAKGERQLGDLGLSFAQGLSMLAANRPAEADAYFRAALRQSSDFIGAAFYLGATLAANGRDRDAVGAWQTALIGDVGAPGIYPVLIDGLLRLGESEEALEFLKEAEPTFADRDEYNRRLVQAHALAGRYGDALPVAHSYLSRHPGDANMLFLVMHMIYEAHASGELPDGNAELARFSEYAAKYETLGGPQSAIVQGWRKALGVR